MKAPSLIEKAFLLKRTTLFADINLDNLVAIAEKLDSVSLEAKEFIYKKNQPTLYMYLIAHGEVEIFDDPKKLIATRGSGEVFGEITLFRGNRRPYQAQAKTRVHLLALTKKHLTAIIAECPSVAIKLLETFAHQVSLNPLEKI